ncbi:Phage gp6-like head-tail connector protein [Sphingomonas gellani]|uniref:Phage gp6-like head-tail connector protein n=1 Tax=Sphingomonas gellani TaxID=1166340 RepID=A0A1H7Z5R8_9SPHN|nr:head-tail connector protein [Sphingomonas gellani]SEM53780.1 Phage gp6-like head-tail connector protein [Sphingomonas gellani]
MAEPVSVAQLEVQLRLAVGGSGEEASLAALIVAARRAVENFLDRSVVGDDASLSADDLLVAALAILMLAAHLYENRDGGDGLPGVVGVLLWPLRRWSV